MGEEVDDQRQITLVGQSAKGRALLMSFAYGLCFAYESAKGRALLMRL